jgi:hypothetical protein
MALSLEPGPSVDDLKAALNRIVAKNEKKNIAENKCELEKTDDDYFLEEFQAVNLSGRKLEESKIPRFYSVLPSENDELKQKLREEARAQFLQRRSRSLLDNDELKRLYSILESNSTAPDEDQTQWAAS